MVDPPSCNEPRVRQHSSNKRVRHAIAESPLQYGCCRGCVPTEATYIAHYLVTYHLCAPPLFFPFAYWTAAGYRYTSDLLRLDGCRAPRIQKLTPSMGTIVSPLRWGQWQAGLANHPDKAFASFVTTGIREGFRIGYDTAPRERQSAAKNMPSALERREVVSSYLAKECTEGRVLGSFEERSLPQLHVNRIGVVPKHAPGQWRLIVDLSYPEGLSVNDGICKQWCSLSYISVDTAARVVAQKGQRAQLAKIDIKSAYRMLPVHPDDRWLLGMRWEGALFVDAALPFGLRSAPKIFTAVADALEWMIEQEGVCPIMHYLDDFLLVGTPDGQDCSRSLDTFLTMCDCLGVPIAWDKLVGPTTVLTFLGIEIDTHSMQLRLPEAKLNELRQLTTVWKGKQSCRRKELESLIGKLQFASTVVKPGRTFLRRLFELLSATRKDHHHIALRGTAKSDIIWWNTFLELWNGVSLIPAVATRRASHHVFTDASGSTGCGATWGCRWLQYQWQGDFREKPIATQELLPILLAGMVWGCWWVGGTVTVHCDNQAVVSVVNSGYSKDRDMMHMLRCLFFVCAYWGFEVRVEHIPGERNVAADAISCGNMHSFFQVLPNALPQASPIPPVLIELLVTQCPDWTSPSWATLFMSCLQQVWLTQPNEYTSPGRGGTSNFAKQPTSHRFQRQKQPSPCS